MNKKLLSIIALILVMCFALVGCGETVNTPTPHTHTFESGDNWEMNATGHWHKALCNHNDQIADFDDHNDDNDDGVCDDCGYSDPNHKHTYGSAWYFDATKHWNKSDCQHTGVIGNEAPHTPDILGICTVCGAEVSNPDVSSVESALELGVAMKDKVASGTIVENDEKISAYEFRDGYLYIRQDSYGLIKHIYYAPTADGVLGVEETADFGVQSILAVEANLWGPEIQTYFMGGLDDNIYGAEYLLESLYEIATANANEDFTESANSKNADGNTVYKFSFGNFSGASLYIVEVEFTLNTEKFFIETLKVTSTEYMGEENIIVVTEPEGMTPGVYTLAENATAFMTYTVEINQSEQVGSKNPYAPEDVLMKDYVLVGPDGSVVEDTVHITRGEEIALQFQVVSPEGTNFYLNTITFSGEGVYSMSDTEYDSGLFANYYAGDDYFTLSTYFVPAGTEFKLVINANGCERELTVVIDATIPTEIVAGTVEDLRGVDVLEETDYVEITEGDSVIIAARSDKRVTDFTITINPEFEIPEDARFYSLVNVLYYEDPESEVVDHFDTFFASALDLSCLPMGDYFVTFATEGAEGAAFTKTIYVKVNEKADVEEGISGTYNLVDYYFGTATTYTYTIDETTSTVVFSDGENETVYTYVIEEDTLKFTDANGNSVSPYIASITLDADGKPYDAYCLGNGTRYELQLAGEGGDKPDDPEIPDDLITGTLTVNELTTELGIAGEYTYTIDANNVVTVYMNGAETEMIGFVWNDMDNCFVFISNNMGVNMSLGLAIFCTAEGNPVTELNGTFSLYDRRMPVVEFTFTQSEGGDKPDDEAPEMTGTGSLFDPYVITAGGNYNITAPYMGAYVNFVATENCTVVFNIGGSADMIPTDFGYPYAFANESYSTNLTAGTTFSFVLAGIEGAQEVVLGITVTTDGDEGGNTPVVPEGDPVKDSILGTYQVNDFNVYIYKDNGVYLFNTYNNSMTIDNYYTFTATENTDGTITIVPTYYNHPNFGTGIDEFGVDGKSFIATPNGFGGWDITLADEGGDEPEEPVIEMTGSGTTDDPYVINGKGYFDLGEGRTFYVTFVATKKLEVSFTPNADMVAEGGTNRVARKGETYTVVLEAGSRFEFFISSNTKTNLNIEIATNVPPYIPEVPEDNSVMNSMIDKTYDVDGNSYYFYKDSNGYYIAEVYGTIYYFEIAETEGNYKLTLTARYEDLLDLATAEIYMENNELVGWILNVNGKVSVEDPVKESLMGSSFTVADMFITFGYDWSNNSYIIEGCLNDGQYNYVTYGYNVTDNGNGTYTVTAETTDEDTLGLATKTIIIYRNDFDGWSIEVDGNAQSGDPACDALIGSDYTVDNLILSFGKDTDYYVFVTDNNTNYISYTYTIVDNNDGTFTVTITGTMYGLPDNLNLVDKTFTAVYAEKAWTITLDKATEPETPVIPDTLTDEEKAGIEKLAETYAELKPFIENIKAAYNNYKYSGALDKIKDVTVSEEEKAGIEKLVMGFGLKDEISKDIILSFSNRLAALKQKLYDEQTVTTIEKALESDVGTRVVLTGYVSVAGEWGSTQGWMNITLKDSEGNIIPVQKLATKVALGDTIVVTGVIAVNSGERVVADGATAEIKEVHGDNHTYENDACIYCGKEEPAEGEKTVKCDFTGITGEANADETYKFGDVTFSTYGNGCQIDNELIIIGKKKSAYAIIESQNVITSIDVNAAGKMADTVIEISVDGVTWVKVTTIMPMNDDYKNFTKTFDESLGYKFIKFTSSVGGVRVKDITITVVG